MIQRAPGRRGVGGGGGAGRRERLVLRPLVGSCGVRIRLGALLRGGASPLQPQKRLLGLLQFVKQHRLLRMELGSLPAGQGLQVLGGGQRVHGLLFERVGLGERRPGPGVRGRGPLLGRPRPLDDVRPVVARLLEEHTALDQLGRTVSVQQGLDARRRDALDVGGAGERGDLRARGGQVRFSSLGRGGR